ncbi:MAG: trypsin-like peptidase domain-containing protein [Clostridia bacterium]|nr:trypsin-like peptidase domain-containing protein [Clostridia bacterium]
MKNKIIKGFSLAMITVMLVVSLTSCLGLTPGGNNNTVTEAGGDTIVNNVTINPSGADVATGANEGLRSIVSIYCTYGNSLFGSNGAAGSGIIYKLTSTGDAFIITNYHVVYDSTSASGSVSKDIKVYLYGMESSEYGIPATYVGGSMNYDIAVLRVDNSVVLRNAVKSGSAQAVKIADSDKVFVGQSAIAIGNPQSQGISVTVGAISVDSEYITLTGSDGSTEVTMRVMRTDTAVNSGNSGGGFFNTSGELIGVINAKIINANVENIGYAIPSSVARAIADNIIDYCYGKDCETVMRGMLGISIATSGLSTYYDTETGMLVKCEEIKVHDVTTGGLGSEILKKDDIIKSVTIGSKTVKVTRQHHIIDAMLDVRVGQTVYIEIIRNGETKTVSTVITEDCLTAY